MEIPQQIWGISIFCLGINHPAASYGVLLGSSVSHIAVKLRIGFFQGKN